MLKPKWIIITVLVLAVGGVGGYFITSAVISGNSASETTNGDKVSEASKQMRPEAEGVENSLTRTQSEGAVVVKATLLPEKSTKNKLVFEIVMNTHSVNLLKYDISNITDVSFGTERATQNFKWDATSKDSHHIMGYLMWNGHVKEGYENISLNIKGIDQIPSRVFSWQKNELKGTTLY
ncbi:hypothetical protein [Neobacillus drentensis]|jgi:hypothetical protein|uniref:hypothetical protein n=1 Tax=Neobacillus drentensis TaxID=220684 RepID=UPI002FFDDE29